VAYRTDGSSHKTGTDNESKMVKVLNGKIEHLFPEEELEDSILEERGGTQVVEDMVAIRSDRENFRVSIKHKKGTKNGSFDYFNSSEIVKSSRVFLGALEVHSILHGSARNYEEVKSEMRNACHVNLKELNSGDLSKILKKLCSHYDGVATAITDSVSRKVYGYYFVDTPLHHSIVNDEPFIEVSAGSTSATIKFRDQNNNVIDHGLRIRLGVNNGYTMLVKGGSSSVVVKLQQDNVYGMLNNITKKNIINY
jgi:hypothetical protein